MWYESIGLDLQACFGCSEGMVVTMWIAEARSFLEQGQRRVVMSLLLGKASHLRYAPRGHML